MQKDNNLDVVIIAYGSRALSQMEKHYLISELKMLGLVFGIKLNHDYLSTQHFTHKTDHKILATMFKWKKKSGTLTRWMLCLTVYDFDIVYQRGSLNSADFLSRIENSSSTSNHDDSYTTETIAFTCTHSKHTSDTTVMSEQKQGRAINHDKQ